MTIPKDILAGIESHAKHLSPITTAAQWFLESGFRPNQKMSGLASPPNHNLFGIKANDPQFKLADMGKTWNWFDTHEHVGGKKVAVKDKFRVYPSYEASIKDHDDFFISTPARVERYRKTREATTLEEEVAELGKSGYATDPKYADKLWNIIDTYKLRELFDESEIEKFKKKETNNMGLISKLISEAPKHSIQVVDRRQHAMGGQAVNRSLSAIKRFVWHYTAVPRSYNRKIWNHEEYWKNTHGWDRGGYHFYIDSDGVLYINYNPERITWGVAYNNDDTLHVSLEANSATDYSEKQKEVRDFVTRVSMNVLGIPASRVLGHWEVYNNTNCPGYTKAQMDAYRAKLAVPRAEAYNPQGLDTEKPAPYIAPDLPFERLAVGETVTITEDKEDGEYRWRWYDLGKAELLKSKRLDEIAGTTDKVVEVKDVPKVSSSSVAYKLEKYNSWILEEYLNEPRKNWKLVGDEEHELPDYAGNFVSWNGKRYKIGEEIK